MGESEGLKITDIANLLGVSTAMAKVIVRPLVDENHLLMKGIKRGAKYYLPE